jgi:Squalene-hopene cyclase C-terminal domain
MRVSLREVLQVRNGRLVARACVRALLPKGTGKTDLIPNMEAAFAWICAAQDARQDGGVAGCYNFIRGWGESYPETTGYIIPTFLHYARVTRNRDARVRALRMADWETEIQLPTGAVRSGMLNVKVGPAVFNTGQVLFGWVAAYQETGREEYADAMRRAGDWLLSIQDGDGAWRKYLSLLTTSRVQSYNSRTAWGLALAGREIGEEKFVQAAAKNCDWVLEQQRDNGWFAKNAFADDEMPLLHTIGYVLEGLLGAGEALNCEKYVAATIRGVKPLINLYERTGVLLGRYDSNWQPTVSWRCVTGEAQIALVLCRLYNITGESVFRETAKSLLEGVAQLQDISSPHSESFGGLTGSEPVWGGYSPFNYLNWAAKFFLDALLLLLFKVDVQHSPCSSEVPVS